MRIAFFGHGKFYQTQVRALGARVHIEQILKRLSDRGHELWSSNPPPDLEFVERLPAGRVARINHLRSMDLLYARVDFELPLGWWWEIDAARALFPRMIWELNCVPEFGQYAGRKPDAIESNIQYFKRLAKVCDLAICVSEPMAAYARNNLGLKKTKVIPNGSDPVHFQPGRNSITVFDRDALNVVFLSGSNLHNQNIFLLCDVARRLLAIENNSNIKLHTIGPFDHKLVSLPNIEIHGITSYENLPYWLDGMDVGLCLYPPGPCEYASPLKFYDYLAAGLAVISTPQSQVGELMQRFNCPDLMVNADDPDAILERLLALEADRERVKQLGALGRQAVIDYYNWNRVAEETVEAIDSVLPVR